MIFSESLLDDALPTRKSAPLVLLVDDEPDVRLVYRRVLERGGTYRVLEASDGTTALTLARSAQPDLIISDLVMPGIDGFALCLQVKADEALADTMFMVVSGHGETERKTAGLLLGVDDYVTKPVDAGELIARTRSLIRQKQLADSLRAEHAALASAKAVMSASFEQLLDLLGQMLDVARPGAGARSQRLADAAAAVGARCDIPPEYLRELVTAARLAPLAELSGATESNTRSLGDGMAAAQTGTPWRKMIALQSVLGRVAQLAPISELLGAIYENWDGTGQPGHTQKGQIPMRSRILRVLLEYFALLDSGMPSAGALELLHEGGSTKFDPTVVALVAAWTRDGGALPTDRRFVEVEALEAGMTLAEDLHTATGVLLLKSGATITSTMLQLVQRRHQNDPVLVGPYVRLLGG